MKKYVKYIFLLIFGLTLVTNQVRAEECDYKTRAELNKLASKVTADYEIKKNNGVSSFDITIHNITGNLYAIVTPTDVGTKRVLDGFQVFPSMTTNGSYTFHVDDIERVISYKITVRAVNTGCIDDIYTFYLTKPRRNKFFDKDICKFDEVLDYYYCQEWVDTTFSLVDSEIEKKIEEKRNQEKKTGTTRCLECEAEARTEAKRSRAKLIKMYIITGLIIGIIIDVITIIVLIKNLRRSII